MGETILSASISVIVSSPLLAHTTQLPALKQTGVEATKSTQKAKNTKRIRYINVELGSFAWTIVSSHKKQGKLNNDNKLIHLNDQKDISKIKADHKVRNDRQDQSIALNNKGHESNRVDINQASMEIESNAKAIAQTSFEAARNRGAVLI
ncbi:hypothetical protein FQP88_20345 [Vibrio atlanticus]|nr:hypothetical protein FQP88_20345 [Vibrio atlanticus]